MFNGFKPVPEPSLRRLPSYLYFLQRLKKTNKKVVSCSVIGQELRFDPTQVRKDLQYTGIVGKSKVGYEIDKLIAAIEAFLGWDVISPAILVGVGSLGSAVLGYPNFHRHGLKIVAAFDRDESKIGNSVHNTIVQDIDTITDFVHDMGIYIGIITVPPDDAQMVTDQLVLGGIKAIWNFAPVALSVPQDIIVQNEDLFASFPILSNKLWSKIRKETLSQ